MSNLRKQVANLISGEPRRSLKYVGKGYAVDETGKPYYVESVEQRETRRRIMAQKGAGRSESFVWSRLDGMPYVIESLSTAQCGHLLMLSTYVDYDGLLIRNENDITPMNSADMRKLLRLSDSTFYDFMKACSDCGIISEIDGRYYINGDYHFKGKTAGDRVAKTVNTRLREWYRELGAHNLGILYRLIPYINVETNMLCANPEEKNPKYIKKLNRKELAEVVDVNPAVISRAVGRMIYKGVSVFAKITTATDGTFYMINPKVISRNDRNYDTTVKAIFGIE